MFVSVLGFVKPFRPERIALGCRIRVLGVFPLTPDPLPLPTPLQGVPPVVLRR